MLHVFLARRMLKPTKWQVQMVLIHAGLDDASITFYGEGTQYLCLK